MARCNLPAAGHLQVVPFRTTHVSACVFRGILDQHSLAGFAGIKVFAIVGTEIEVYESYEGIAYCN